MLARAGGELRQQPARPPRSASADSCGGRPRVRVRRISPRRTRSAMSGVRVDLSRLLARLSAVWLMPGLLADQGERREAAGPHADLLRQPRERLERGVLRHAQVEADPLLQRTVVDPPTALSRTALSRTAPLRMAPLRRACRSCSRAWPINPRASSPSPCGDRSRPTVLYPTIRLYNAPDLGLNDLQPLALRINSQEGGEDVIASNRTPARGARRVCNGVAVFGRRAVGARPGQDRRAQAVALGAAHPSAAEGDGGLGLVDREGVERDHQVQDLPVAAARQGVRPLRHGARRHRRPHLRQSRLSARPLPDHRGRRAAVPGRQCQGRQPGRSTRGIANTPPPR